RDRAVDGPALGSEAPQQVVVPRGVVHRPLALGALALAAQAERLAAAVVVRDDVVPAVARMPAGADPGHRRHLRSRRAGVLRAAAAGAQEAVDGAVAPVGAARRITDGGFETAVIGRWHPRGSTRRACPRGGGPPGRTH